MAETPPPTPRTVRSDAAGGTVPDFVTGTLSLADGGVWTAGTIQVGDVTIGLNGFGGTPNPGVIEVASSGTGMPTRLEAAAIILGADGNNPDAATPSVNGTLDVSGGSEIDTSDLSLVDGSHVTIDAASSVVVGSGAAVAGALVVGGGTTLSAITGNIFANVVLTGTIRETATFLFFGDGGDRFQIDGALTGTGAVLAGSTPVGGGSLDLTGAMLEIGDASTFAGTISLVPGQLLVLDRGDAPDATLTMTNATVDLLGDPYTGQAPSYDAAHGLLMVGTATLHVGAGLSAGDFATRTDFAGGTMVIGHRLPTWQAVGGDPNGDWGDTAHWSTGNLPLTTDTVSIGPGITTATPWTLTAANRVALDLTLSMGVGTLAASGGFDMNDALTLESGTLISTAGAQIGAPTYDQLGGLLDAAGGQVFTTYATLDGTAGAAVRDGGSWAASELSIGSTALGPASDVVTVAGGTLTVQDTLALGTFTFQPTTDAIGTLALTDGAVASAGLLTLSPGSSLSLDGTSRLTVGTDGGTAAAGTILVAGTLDATGTAALAGNLLDQGVVFLGAASVGGVASLYAGATLAGTLSGTGSFVVASDATITDASGFAGSLEIDGLSTLTLLGGAAPVGTIRFVSEEAPGSAVLDLRGVAWGDDTPTYDAVSGVLTVGATTLQVGPNLQNPDFVATEDSVGGTAISRVACFAAGTRIATVGGDAPVECLSVGERVRGPWGEAMAVRWLGHRRVDCARHPRPQDVWPVRVRAGAFRPGAPARDLLLSPDHGVFLAPPGTRPVLIPVCCLVDGASVVQERVAHITYWHVELERHAVLLAEGLPCESFLDIGNRSAFADGGASLQLHPDFAAAQWQARACAPQVRGGPALDWARRWLAERRCEAAPCGRVSARRSLG